MKINLRVWLRKLHRWGAIVVAVPFLIVIGAGVLLQLKKEVGWIQPPTKRGAGTEPTLTFPDLLAAVAAVPEAEVQGWADIDRVDVQPRRGLIKVQCTNRWEVQLDGQTGSVLQVAYRRTDVIESIHDGSWFHESAKLSVFLPVALVVLGLWITGMYLFFLPHAVRWRRARGKKEAEGDVVKA